MTVTAGVPLNWEPPQPGQSLYAVTLREPLASAVLDCGCDVINRQWYAAPHLIERARLLIDHPLLIHAGGQFDRHFVEWVYVRGGQRIWPSQIEAGSLLGLVRLLGVDLFSDSAWYEPGAIALTVGEPVRFDVAIACRGERGWPVA